MVNTCFEKEDAKKVSYESSGSRTVVDYMLVRKHDSAKVSDVKVVPNEACVTQHKLMICVVWKVETRCISKYVRCGN